MEGYLEIISFRQDKNFSLESFDKYLTYNGISAQKESHTRRSLPHLSTNRESIIHVLWNCTASSDVWALAKQNTHKWPQDMDDVHQLWNQIATAQNINEISLTAIIMRNRIFGDEGTIGFLINSFNLLIMWLRVRGLLNQK